jgi:hypothetical protein
MHTTVDQTLAEISALISGSGARANKLARLLAATAKAALAKGAAKAISNQARAESAAPGVHRIKGAVGLYLKKGEAALAHGFIASASTAGARKWASARSPT